VSQSKGLYVLRFIGERALHAVVVVVLAATGAFFLMEAVPGDIGLKLGPDTGFEGVRTMIVDSPAEFAHGNNPGRGIGHGGQLTL